MFNINVLELIFSETSLKDDASFNARIAVEHLSYVDCWSGTGRWSLAVILCALHSSIIDSRVSAIPEYVCMPRDGGHQARGS